MQTNLLLLPALLGTALTGCEIPSSMSAQTPASGTLTSAASGSSGMVVSNAAEEVPKPAGIGAINYPPPQPPDIPAPPPAPARRPDPSFRPVAFETEGSPPGIRAQYEAAARAYREAAAQSGSPEREQYLEAARQLDQQAAALGTR